MNGDKKGNNVIVKNGVESGKEDKLRKTISQRDNEIVILLEKLKGMDTPQNLIQTNVTQSTINSKQPQLEIQTQKTKQLKVIEDIKDNTQDTLEEFTLFQSKHPNQKELNSLKHLLSQKYTLAKTLGTEAQLLRSKIRNPKSPKKVINLEQGAKEEALEYIEDYKERVGKLKVLKEEIEHLQRGYDGVKIRIQRDFDAKKIVSENEIKGKNINIVRDSVGGDRREYDGDVYQDTITSSDEGEIKTIQYINNEHIVRNDLNRGLEQKIDSGFKNIDNDPYTQFRRVEKKDTRDTNDRYQKNEPFTNIIPAFHRNERSFDLNATIEKYSKSNTSKIEIQPKELLPNLTKIVVGEDKKDIRAEIRAFYEARDRILGL